MSIYIDLINDILTNTVVSQSSIMGETLFVESNPAIIEIVNVKKVKSNIERVTETKEYKLSHKGLLINDKDKDTICNKISISVDDLFIDTIESSSIKEKFKIKSGLLNLFKRKQSQDILNLISDQSDWIITSPDVLLKLSKLNEFIPVNSELKSSIELSGKIGKLNIFTKSDIKSNYIYEGSCKETSAVFLKEVTISFDSNLYDIGFDFIFTSKGVRTLILE
jgi:hypothetical protein